MCDFSLNKQEKTIFFGQLSNVNNTSNIYYANEYNFPNYIQTTDNIPKGFLLTNYDNYENITLFNNPIIEPFGVQIPYSNNIYEGSDKEVLDIIDILKIFYNLEKEAEKNNESIKNVVEYTGSNPVIINILKDVSKAQEDAYKAKVSENDVAAIAVYSDTKSESNAIENTYIATSAIAKVSENDVSAIAVYNDDKYLNAKSEAKAIEDAYKAKVSENDVSAIAVYNDDKYLNAKNDKTNENNSVVTTPTIITPTVTTPAVTTPAVITPAVTTPTIITPTVTTPTIITPAVSTPAVSTPVSSNNSSFNIFLIIGIILVIIIFIYGFYIFYNKR